MPDNIMRIQGQDEIRAGIYYEVDLSVPNIGEGGMGRVYKGYQVNPKTGTRLPVAVKFLYEGLPQNALDRAIREASIKIKCENLIEMIAFIQTEQPSPYGTPIKHYHVVSELLEGVMLHDLIQGRTTGADGQPIEYAEELCHLRQDSVEAFAIEITKKVVSGLMYLHDAGYVHRDIDPSNIMVTSDHKIKLIDFGVAHKMETHTDSHALTHVGSFLGKAEYAAPELILGDIPHQNATTDIYAVGILLFQLLTGKQPFTGSLQEVMQMQREQELPLEQIKNDKLRDIVRKATQKRQSERYQSAAEFRGALDDVAITIRNSVSSTESDDTTPIATEPVTSTIHNFTGEEAKSNKAFWLYLLGIAVTGLLTGTLLAFIL